MQEKSINRYKSFCMCLDDFKLSKTKDYTDSFILSGIIQKFSLTFDLAWKVMKDILIDYYGIEEFATGSPKDTLRTATTNKIISDEIWLEMQKVRNDLVHDYNYVLANLYINNIVNQYVDTFLKFRDDIKKFYE